MNHLGHAATKTPWTVNMAFPVCLIHCAIRPRLRRRAAAAARSALACREIRRPGPRRFGCFGFRRLPLSLSLPYCRSDHRPARFQNREGRARRANGKAFADHPVRLGACRPRRNAGNCTDGTHVSVLGSGVEAGAAALQGLRRARRRQRTLVWLLATAMAMLGPIEGFAARHHKDMPAHRTRAAEAARPKHRSALERSAAARYPHGSGIKRSAAVRQSERSRAARPVVPDVHLPMDRPSRKRAPTTISRRSRSQHLS
jgi:hypothetical protein